MMEDEKYKALVAEKWSDHVLHIPQEVEKYKDINNTLIEMRDGIKSPKLNEDVVAFSRNTNGDDAMFNHAFGDEATIEENAKIINELMAERKDYLITCSKLESPLCELLSHRYVRRETWDEVASMIGYSNQHSREHLKNKALLALYDVIPDVYLSKFNTP